MKQTLMVVALVGMASFATPALAGSIFVTEPPDAEQSRAFRYAALESRACLDELTARKVSFVSVAPTPGVDTPIRLVGPLHGVTFRPVIQSQPDEENIHTIADCRLGLALDDLATVLEKQGATQVEYYNMYRKRGLGFIKPGKRHPGGRAIDLVSVTLKTGEIYSVEHDFHGRPGTWTCGDKASLPRKDTPGARFFRSVVCELDAMRSFNLLLTPNHDGGHRDHLHMEVRSGIAWFLVH